MRLSKKEPMNLIQNPALLERLVASYARGTLRGGARRRFETLARNHAEVRAQLMAWQGQMTSVAELQPQAATAAAKLEHSGWWDSMNLWRGLSSMGLGVAAVALMVALNLNSINAKLGDEVQVLTARLGAAPDIQYVAVLVDEKTAASMLVTFDLKSRQLTLKRVGGFQVSPDKSLQLWAWPQVGSPTSLGLLGGDLVVKLSADGHDMNVPALAISLEPKGGVSSGGGPTGPVLFKGALIKTAP